MSDALSRLRHDLKTPVNHILGYSELLEEELGDRGVSGLDDLQRIRQASKTLLDLIETRLSDASIPAIEPASSASQIFPETAPSETEVTIKGRILVVDDDAANRDVLGRYLLRQGHSTADAADGCAALKRLREETFDAVLLDVLMPELDGFAALLEIKADPALRHLPVIMISALDELAGVVRCIEAGAEDYLPKPFNATLLRARLGACLEKKHLRDQEQEYLRTIEETQARLSSELTEAANYVRSILPKPEREPFPIDWSYVPSTELGGDAFGYHWIDADHFAIYLLDVCGHGVGASLLSVSAINVIRAGALIGTDLRDPAAVLEALNDAFPMEEQNNMYFTVWYGVFRCPTRRLIHASAGHPPALLIGPDSKHADEVLEPGTIIGVVPKKKYTAGRLTIPPGATLIVLCDGTYEIRTAEGHMLDFDTFREFVGREGCQPDFFQRLLDWVHQLRGEASLDDDFSVLRIVFP